MTSDSQVLVEATHEADGTAQRYLARARDQLSRGAGPDWTGVEVMERK